jgi:hypothetical protein
MVFFSPWLWERSGSPHRADEWRNWIRDHSVSQGTYSSVRTTLIEQGLISKDKEGFYLDTRFVNELTNELFEFLGIVKNK